MLRLVLKDLKLFIKDRRAILVTFALPIALATMFAFAFGGAGKSNDEEKKIDLVLADEDKSVVSVSLVTKLDSTKEFNVIRAAKDTAEGWVKKGKLAAVLVLHKGLSDSLDAGHPLPIELKYDQAREIEALMLIGSITGNLMEILGPKIIKKRISNSFPDFDTTMFSAIQEQTMKGFEGGGDTSNKSGATSSKKGKQREPMIKATALVAEKENSPGLIQAIAGTSIMMLLFAVVGMGASLLEEKEEGTLKKLLYAPVNPNQILFGKMIYVTLISIVQMVVVFLYANFVFGLDIFHHVTSMVLAILCASYACSSFGVFLASFARTRQQVQGLSSLIILVMSCIGGSMIPIFMMPAFMQKLSVFSVNYWAIQSFYDIFWRNLPATDSDFHTRLLMMLLIGTTMNSIALVMFRRNILKIAQ